MIKNVVERIRRSFTGRKKILIVSCAAGVVLISAVFVLWNQRVGQESDGGSVRLKIIPDHVDLQIKDIHFTEVGDPDLIWEIQADTARFLKKENLAQFDHVKMRIIRTNGRSLTLTGNEGILHTDSRDADVLGNVVVVSDSGDVVETDLLHFSNQDRKITTAQRITLTNPRMTVQGTGMSLSIPEQKVSLLSGVKAVVKAK